MHTNKHGYVAGAALMIPVVNKIREHIEWEKYWARQLVDNDDTQEFKKKTQGLKDRIWAFRFNSAEAEAMTARGRANGNK
jgi:hypothetical protein